MIRKIHINRNEEWSNRQRSLAGQLQRLVKKDSKVMKDARFDTTFSDGFANTPFVNLLELRGTFRQGTTYDFSLHSDEETSSLALTIGFNLYDVSQCPDIDLKELIAYIDMSNIPPRNVYISRPSVRGQKKAI